jgi:hypothetical protein
MTIPAVAVSPSYHPPAPVRDADGDSAAKEASEGARAETSEGAGAGPRAAAPPAGAGGLVNLIA